MNKWTTGLAFTVAMTVLGAAHAQNSDSTGRDELTPPGAGQSQSDDAATDHGTQWDANTDGIYDLYRYHWDKRYDLDTDAADDQLPSQWRDPYEAYRGWRNSDRYWRQTDRYWRSQTRTNPEGAEDYWITSDEYWRDSDRYWNDSRNSRDGDWWTEVERNDASSTSDLDDGRGLTENLNEGPPPGVDATPYTDAGTPAGASMGTSAGAGAGTSAGAGAGTSAAPGAGTSGGAGAGSTGGANAGAAPSPTGGNAGVSTGGHTGSSSPATGGSN